jgi:hypothetical protein
VQSVLRLWAFEELQAYEASLTQKKEMPLGYSVPAEHQSEAPVLQTPDEFTVNRGAGGIAGTGQI